MGFDNVEPSDLSPRKAASPSLPPKRSFFGLGRLLQSNKSEAPAVEPEKKPVRCFECGHIHEVSVAATSTQCARCSLYISLGNEEIREQYSRNIRTRGDVTIHKKGSVIGCEIACHNLTVLGGISGSVDCSGNATFKNSGKVLGSMHCKHIIIDRKCELDFPQGIIAESADIYGVIRGDILCSGTIHIFKTGSILGDATAKAIVMKDGGVLTGQMNIQHDANINLPEKGAVRTDPSVQEDSAPPKKTKKKSPTPTAEKKNLTPAKKVEPVAKKTDSSQSTTTPKPENKTALDDTVKETQKVKKEIEAKKIVKDSENEKGEEKKSEPNKPGQKKTAPPAEIDNSDAKSQKKTETLVVDNPPDEDEDPFQLEA